jgi:hypothetical protein
VQITPSQFEKHSRIAIENNINAKYANRVIQKIGLCVCLYDLLWSSEGLIGHGTGLVNVNGMLSSSLCITVERDFFFLRLAYPPALASTSDEVTS